MNDKTQEALKLALEALEHDTEPEPKYGVRTAIDILREALAEQPAQQQQEPVGVVGTDIGGTHLMYGTKYVGTTPDKKTAIFFKDVPVGSPLYTSPQPAQEQDIPKIGCVNHDCDKCKAQQQSAERGEPVAWMYQCSADSSGPVLTQHKKDWAESGSGLWTEKPLYTSPQPAQQHEPVAIADGTFNHNCPIGTPLYTSPPANANAGKPWVGLDETDLAVCDTDGVRLARYWERVLREKNNGTR